jgi:hypothetical protein
MPTARTAALLNPIRSPPQAFWIGEHGDEMFIVSGKVISTPTVRPRNHRAASARRCRQLSLLDGVPAPPPLNKHRGPPCWSWIAGLQISRNTTLAAVHSRAWPIDIAGMGTAGRENVNRRSRRITPSGAGGWAAAFAFQWWVLLGNTVFFIVWMLVFTIVSLARKTDVSLLDSPPTFAILAFFISLESMLMTLFILNSQNRQSERDRVKADFEYQVNLKAQYEVMQLHSKIDRLGMISQPEGSASEAGNS